MLVETIVEQTPVLLEAVAGKGRRLYRQAQHQHHFVVNKAARLLEICQLLVDEGAFLVTAVSNDETYLDDSCFKLYYIFSVYENVNAQLIIIEFLLGSESYVSIAQFFPAVLPFEQANADLLGIVPSGQTKEKAQGTLLHRRTPIELNPLRYGKRMATLRQAVQDCERDESEARFVREIKPGLTLLPVGPVHAGIIESGHFRFHVLGEVIHEVEIRLGYKHKGIEKLFTAKFPLLDGWKLAEKISGDSSFAHSLAYCRAVEALVPQFEVPKKGQYLRGFFLELERIYNHVNDIRALAKDVAFDLVASEIGVLWQYLMRLNQELAGHRLLRGLILPGGVVVETAVSHAILDKAIEKISNGRFTTFTNLIDKFLELGYMLLDSPLYRRRAWTIGVLTPNQARQIGATGFAARASGLKDRDFRLKHPAGVYKLEPAIRQLVADTIPPQPKQRLESWSMRGDVFARTRLRLLEVAASAKIIAAILDKLPQVDEQSYRPIKEALRQAPNYQFGLGYCEGWRGDIVYWLMKDKFGAIHRCHVRDPSMLNWPAMKAAIDPHPFGEAYTKKHKPRFKASESLLADFPLINKSFNLSYSGNDL